MAKTQELKLNLQELSQKHSFVKVFHELVCLARDEIDISSDNLDEVYNYFGVDSENDPNHINMALNDALTIIKSCKFDLNNGQWFKNYILELKENQKKNTLLQNKYKEEQEKLKYEELKKKFEK